MDATQGEIAGAPSLGLWEPLSMSSACLQRGKRV